MSFARRFRNVAVANLAYARSVRAARLGPEPLGPLVDDPRAEAFHLVAGTLLPDTPRGAAGPALPDELELVRSRVG